MHSSKLRFQLAQGQDPYCPCGVLHLWLDPVRKQGLFSSLHRSAEFADHYDSRLQVIFQAPVHSKVSYQSTSLLYRDRNRYQYHHNCELVCMCQAHRQRDLPPKFQYSLNQLLSLIHFQYLIRYNDYFHLLARIHYPAQVEMQMKSHGRYHQIGGQYLQ